MSEEYRVSEIEIENLFGTKYFKFAPKTFTILKGSNGAGKTSIEHAVAIIFEGGYDPCWVRKGAKKGQITVRLNTGDKITKVVKLDGFTLDAWYPNGKPRSAPMEFVKTLGESWSIDPSKLLAIDASTKAGRKLLIAELLKLMPLEFTATDLEQAALKLDKAEAVRTGSPEVGEAYRNAVKSEQVLAPSDLVDLKGINEAYKDMEEVRRQVGRDQRDKEGTIVSLRGSLPPEQPAGQTSDPVAKQKELDVLTSQEHRQRFGVNQDAATKRERITKEANQKAKEAMEAYNQACRLIESEQNKALREINEAEKVALDETGEKYRPQRESLAAEISASRERADAHQRAQGIRVELERHEKAVGELTNRYDALTMVLRAIEQAKKDKADALPVPGLKVEGDEVTIDGIPWQITNTGKLVTTVLTICASRRGALPFIVVDELGRLDEITQKAVIEGAIQAGYQVLAAKVEVGPEGEWLPLTIQSIEAGEQPDGTLAVDKSL